MRYGMMLLTALVTAGCTTTPSAQDGEVSPTVATNQQRREGSVTDIDVDGLKAALDDDGVAILVDVRTPEEFAEGHVPGAVNYPLNELGEHKADLAAYRDKEVHVICRSGARSAKAAQLLSAGGWDTVNVSGGTLAWLEKGYATE